MVILSSDANAGPVTGGCSPTGSAAAQGQRSAEMSSPCTHRPSSLLQVPLPGLVIGQCTGRWQRPLQGSVETHTECFFLRVQRRCLFVCVVICFFFLVVLVIRKFSIKPSSLEHSALNSTLCNWRFHLSSSTTAAAVPWSCYRVKNLPHAKWAAAPSRSKTAVEGRHHLKNVCALDFF